ncbi:hypothetical protein [Scopulibacillus cellulosilyticus]|uniref:Uncharacterized protein n=1 Tax=Scopulibacillus cellulosilyticus TaxID=2665665 RepID=A0ABW2PW88_9BACL
MDFFNNPDMLDSGELMKLALGRQTELNLDYCDVAAAIRGYIAAAT